MAESKSKATGSKSKAPAKTKKPAAKKSAAKTTTSGKSKSSSGTESTNYTKPALRERVKAKVTEGDKGGRPGQWSARKAQLVASEYGKQGGGYKKGSKSAAQKHLDSWTEEKWQTADGKKAIQGKTTARYLPKKAWDELSPAEKQATDSKKKTASKTGKQVVQNTTAAKKARKTAAK